MNVAIAELSSFHSTNSNIGANIIIPGGTFLSFILINAIFLQICFFEKTFVKFLICNIIHNQHIHWLCGCFNCLSWSGLENLQLIMWKKVVLVCYEKRFYQLFFYQQSWNNKLLVVVFLKKTRKMRLQI